MLHITGRREDGYHELQTVFQFIDYADHLKFEVRGDDQIIRHSENFDVPESEDIIIRAAVLLRENFRQKYILSDTVNAASNAVKQFGADIYLNKVIPMGAGLGGGSSDAATTLIALNKLWNTRFTID
ncbi:MAG: hypothetical protein IMF17_07415, partial [Proteobacteria bacterium]|nr:hypothetical protein [Pseudomonadota bacterium]